MTDKLIELCQAIIQHTQKYAGALRVEGHGDMPHVMIPCDLFNPMLAEVEKLRPGTSICFRQQQSLKERRMAQLGVVNHSVLVYLCDALEAAPSKASDLLALSRKRASDNHWFQGYLEHLEPVKHDEKALLAKVAEIRQEIR